MSITTTLAACSQTPSSNGPDGSVDAPSTLDDAIRYALSFIATLRDTKADGTEITVPSATTTPIGASLSPNIIISGTTTITAFDTQVDGLVRNVVFSGALALTHNATTLILPGAANITTTAGDCATFLSLGGGNWRCTKYVRAFIAPSVLRSYLSGLTMSTAGSSATMSIAAGMAADSTNSSLMVLASAFSKTTSAWAVGTGNGGIDTGAIANNTWYHFYLIQRVDTGVVDIVFSTSASAPTLPTNYTLFRRIGSMRTNGSAQWTSFSQNGDEFLWLSPVAEISTTTLGATGTLFTLTLPLGIKFNVILAGYVSHATVAGTFVYLSSPDVTDTAAAPNPQAVVPTAGGFGGLSIWGLRTNTSAQIRARADGANTTLLASTLGWIDRRGRDA